MQISLFDIGLDQAATIEHRLAEVGGSQSALFHCRVV
jgi:hypothetical protein